MKKILTEEQIHEIKDLYFNGMYTQEELARRFHCSVMTICLWLKPDPYSIIKKKYKKKTHFTCVHCPICSICLKENQIICDFCQNKDKRRRLLNYEEDLEALKKYSKI